jgi:hypothetical protein
LPKLKEALLDHREKLALEEPQELPVQPAHLELEQLAQLVLVQQVLLVLEV